MVIRKRTTRFALLALTLLIGATVAALWLWKSPARTACVDNIYFPAEKLNLEPERAARLSAYYSAMLEAPFSCLDEDTEAYRLLFLPAFAPAASIRISRDGNQRSIVVRQLASVDGPQGGAKDLKVNVTGPLTDSEWNHFQELLGKSVFWSMPPPDDRVGLDGATCLLEGHRSNQYHVVMRWSHPEEQNFLDACGYLIDLARLDWKY